MLLDDLYEVIEKLRDKMEIHQDKLKQSEALTRNALVDPWLRALAWDTEDPALTMPEYKLGSGYADYALLSGGKPVIVIEAKKLGTPLYSAAEQSVTYCVNDGIEYFVATDGRKWDVYETHRPVPLADKKIVSFDITDSPANVCLDALVLWRRSVQSGIVRQAHAPLLEPQPEPSITVNQPQSASAPVVSIPSLTIQPHQGNWLPLSQLKPVKGGKSPAEIRFPDGSTAQIQSWSGLSVEVLRWLDQKGKLDESRIPIQSGTQYILSSTPVHPDGSKFKHTRNIGQFYLDTAYSKSGKVKNASTIIEYAGKEVAPTQFSVRIPD